MNISEILYRDNISRNTDFLSMLTVYLMMWAVPVFVMVTGALLLDPSRIITFKHLYTRYISRVFFALLFFGIFFRLFDMIMNKEAFSPAVITDALLKIYTGKSWSHLWYIYLLIGIYVLLPVYRRVSETLDKKEYLYMLAAFAVFLSVLPVTDVFGKSSAFHLQTTAVYLLYFFAGYGIKKGYLKLGKPAALLLFAAGTAGTSILCYVRYLYDLSSADTLLGSYASPFIVMQALSLFSLIYSEKESAGSGFVRFIAYFDKCTFGIYLIHMVFLRLFLRYMEINPYSHGILSFVCIFAVTLVSSFAVVSILRLIPVIRRIV